MYKKVQPKDHVFESPFDKDLFFFSITSTPNMRVETLKLDITLNLSLPSDTQLSVLLSVFFP